LAGHVNETLAPIRERRQQYERHPELVWHVLDDGTKKARKVAKDTMRQVRRAMSLAAPEKGHVDEFLFFEVAHSKLNPPQIGAMQELHDYFRAAAKGKRWARSNGDLRFIAEFSDIATKLTYNLITDGVLTIKLKPLSDAHEAYRKRSEFRSVLEGIGRNRLRDGWEVLTHSFAVSQWQDHVSNLVKATVHLCGEGAPRAKVPDGLPNDYD
jgi:hypothetical protein